MARAAKGTIEYELRGRTFQVYLCLLKHGTDMGVREVQKELGFSSPSIAFDHLNKLVRLGVVQKDQNDRYVLVKKVDAGVLQLFASVAGLAFPRLGFYAIFFTVVAVAYLLAEVGALDPFGIVGTSGVAVALWYEALRLQRRSPF